MQSYPSTTPPVTSLSHHPAPPHPTPHSFGTEVGSTKVCSTTLSAADVQKFDYAVRGEGLVCVSVCVSVCDSCVCL